MKHSQSWNLAIHQLRKSTDADQQIAAILRCRELRLSSAAVLKSYHDTLLFVCAYPFSLESYQLAKNELSGLVVILKDHAASQRWQQALSGSGLPFSEISCQYSASIVQWLCKTFPKQIIPSDAGSGPDAFREFCQSVLPGIEFYHSTQGEHNTWNRIKSLSGHYKNMHALLWLMDLIDQQEWPLVLKDQVYNRLKIYIRWKILANFASRTYLCWPVKSIFCRKLLESKTDSFSILRTTVRNPIPLTSQETESLINVIRTSLALYARETDPVLYADITETMLYEMGDGLQIALIGMTTDRRLSLESYIGYMAFKNGIPVSYGGGWIWGQNCRIGINIYPPFRGGDSDILFSQILRLYFQVYTVRRFEVKPYQFGKGNPEGLKSGAFWFYYKLGFRPVNSEIQQLAETEWKKIKSDSKYRSPVSILKRFTASNKAWEPESNNFIFSDAARVSRAVTNMIIKKFNGNRQLAIQISVKNLSVFLSQKKFTEMSSVSKKVWQNWALLFECLPGTPVWNKRERNKFLHLLELKAQGKEKDFVLELQGFSAFWTSVSLLLQE